MKTENHDKHYSALPIEPITVSEQIMKHNGLPPEQGFHIGIAVHYLMRAGLKEDAVKDMTKARNHIHRAITGRWVGSIEDTPERNESKASVENQDVVKPTVTLAHHKYAGSISAWGFTAKEHGWEGNVSDAMSCDVCAIDYGSSDPFYICKWPYSGEAGSLLEYLHNEMEVRDISQPPEKK